MGIGKIGTTIGKEIVAWTKTGKSLLTSKPVKANINELRLAAPLQTDTFQLSTQIGKHKIPRYLYHMTSPENYQKMLESGVLKPMGCRLPDGVYMLELDSFGKYWSKSLRNDLCDQIFRSGDSKQIVMLKIPTKNLDSTKLRIRTQKQVENGGLGRNAEMELEKWLNFTEMPEERKLLINQLVQKYGKKTALKKYVDMMPKELEPVTKGYEARLSPLFKQKKADLEFVYIDDIPVSEVSVVGKADYKDLFGIEYYSDKLSGDRNTAKTVFEKIFYSKPEQGMLKAWRE